MKSRMTIAILIALSAQAAAAVENVANTEVNSRTAVAFHEASAEQFLPPLEYGLPVEMASDRFGWLKVQHILQSGGFKNLELNGAPDAATLEALTAYLEPLAEQLVARAELAEARAMGIDEIGVEETAPFRYGYWGETETDGQYWGEMYFPYRGDPLPVGYVGVSGSGWPHISEYYRPGDQRTSPLCSLTRFGKASPGYLRCQLLDGVIEIGEEDGMRETIFSVGGQPVASTVTRQGCRDAEAGQPHDANPLPLDS